MGVKELLTRIASSTRRRCRRELAFRESQLLERQSDLEGREHNVAVVKDNARQTGFKGNLSALKSVLIMR